MPLALGKEKNFVIWIQLPEFAKHRGRKDDIAKTIGPGDENPHP
jgi:hypothetical protein